MNSPLCNATELVELRLVGSRPEHSRGAVVAAGKHIWISNEPRLGIDDRDADPRQLELAGIALLASFRPDRPDAILNVVPAQP